MVKTSEFNSDSPIIEFYLFLQNGCDSKDVSPALLAGELWASEIPELYVFTVPQKVHAWPPDGRTFKWWG